MVARCTLERLRELLNYDPDTGIFTRIKGGQGLPPVGSVVGCLNGSGYLVGMIDGRIYLMHQLAWFYIHGEWADRLDHENCKKADNRISNLRPATPSQNEGNKPARSATGFKGVSWQPHAQKYKATIKINGKTIHLGYRDTPDEASKLYYAAAVEYFGEFARAA